MFFKAFNAPPATQNREEQQKMNNLFVNPTSLLLFHAFSFTKHTTLAS